MKASSSSEYFGGVLVRGAGEGQTTIRGRRRRRLARSVAGPHSTLQKRRLAHSKWRLDDLLIAFARSSDRCPRVSRAWPALRSLRRDPNGLGYGNDPIGFVLRASDDEHTKWEIIRMPKWQEVLATTRAASRAQAREEQAK